MTPFVAGFSSCLRLEWTVHAKANLKFNTASYHLEECRQDIRSQLELSCGHAVDMRNWLWATDFTYDVEARCFHRIKATDWLVCYIIKASARQWHCDEYRMSFVTVLKDVPRIGDSPFIPNSGPAEVNAIQLSASNNNYTWISLQAVVAIPSSKMMTSQLSMCFDHRR